MFERFYKNKAEDTPSGEVGTLPQAYLEDIAANPNLREDIGQLVMSHESADMSVSKEVLARVRSGLNIDDDVDNSEVISKAKAIVTALD